MGAPRGIVLHDQRTRIIEQHLLGHAAELHERAFQAIEPALLPFVAECSDMVPARVAQRGDEQVAASVAAADLDQPLAKIDLQLFANCVAAKKAKQGFGWVRYGVGYMAISNDVRLRSFVLNGAP